MENSKSISEILALMFEECKNDVCLMCPDYRNGGQSKKEIVQKYETEIYEYLKTQGIEKA